MVVEFLQLQYIDKMVVQVQQVRLLAARTQSSSHSYSPFLGPGRSHARCVQRQMPMVTWVGRRCDAAATSSTLSASTAGLKGRFF